MSVNQDHNEAPPETPSSGPERIAGYVKTLPDTPGVYRMIDDQDTVLYVGKAKNLRKRVVAYTKYDGHTIRIQRMIRATHDLSLIHI